LLIWKIPSEFSRVSFLFTKLVAQTRNEIIHKTVVTNARKSILNGKIDI
jgi:hypothetical protein